MPNVTAEERIPATDAAKVQPKRYRVPAGVAYYAEVPHRYVCILKGKDAPKTASDLMAPGAWDEVSLEPWDEIDVTYAGCSQPA